MSAKKMLLFLQRSIKGYTKLHVFVGTTRGASMKDRRNGYNQHRRPTGRPYKVNFLHEILR